MHRTEGSNYNEIAGKKFFTNGPPGTTVEQNWLNAVQEEMAAVIEGAGLTLETASTETRVQLKAALGYGYTAGDIKMTGRAAAPDGWFICDGSAISRTVYADLFAAIGTAFGAGDGSTTFTIPNGQGVGVTGAGTQSIAGRAKGGNSLGDTPEDAIQKHVHTLTDNDHPTEKFSSGTGGANRRVIPDANSGGINRWQTSDGNYESEPGLDLPRMSSTENTISSMVVNFIIKY